MPAATRTAWRPLDTIKRVVFASARTTTLYLLLIYSSLLAGAKPVPVTVPDTNNWGIVRHPDMDEDRVIDLPQKRFNLTWLAKGDSIHQRSSSGLVTGNSPRPEGQNQDWASTSTVAPVLSKSKRQQQDGARCRRCADTHYRVPEAQKGADIREGICSMDFAIGARLMSSNVTHHRLRVFAVFAARHKPIYGMMAYHNPRGSSLRPPEISSGASERGARSSGTDDGQGAAGDGQDDDQLIPPMQFILARAPADQCQPCEMRPGRNYFISGSVDTVSDTFQLTADSTVYRWKRKVRHFAETAMRRGCSS
ncbi:uncharacterized protein LOC135821205 [Sycon ciliatum]|uniref:uncharacterized protein LOC135821205 n=1 Tax=Sycon ciliatum TaxID=27933 RepID=UPI0031F6CD09